MKNKNRPISPHLQIYKPQITSILSISHRFTGIILYLSTFLISFWLFCIAFNNNLKNIQENGNQKKGDQISSVYTVFVVAIFSLQPPFAEVLSSVLRAA